MHENDSDSDQETAAAQSKRPWVRPAVVATQAAFEHAILQCNGKPALPAPQFCSQLRQPKGGCVTTSGCTASS